MTENNFENVSGSKESIIAGTCLEKVEIKNIEVKRTSRSKYGGEKEDLKVFIVVKEEILDVDIEGEEEILNRSKTLLIHPSPSEEFMDRLWAFKRINYLLSPKTTCKDEGTYLQGYPGQTGRNLE